MLDHTRIDEETWALVGRRQISEGVVLAVEDKEDGIYMTIRYDHITDQDDE